MQLEVVEQAELGRDIGADAVPQRKRQVVDHLESVLERMGGAEREASGPPPAPAPDWPFGLTGFKWYALWAFGVWLPAGAPGVVVRPAWTEQSGGLLP